MDPAQLTPVEPRGGRLYKREDAYALPCGVNGAKLRACLHLLTAARDRGASAVVSAASVLSPQSAMAAQLAADLGMSCTVIVGGTTPAKAVRHTPIRLAAAAGARLEAIAVGYNPALQRAAADHAAAHPGTYHLPYGITTPPAATPAEIEAFLNVGASQVDNLPDTVATLFIPFGSGNTAAAVLHGLITRTRPAALRRIVLVGIGPDRLPWLHNRLPHLPRLTGAGVTVDHVPLHPTFATYGDRMPANLDGITLHPTYEGKIAHYYSRHRDPDWTRRDSTTCLWIVGGPLPNLSVAAGRRAAADRPPTAHQERTLP